MREKIRSALPMWAVNQVRAWRRRDLFDAFGKAGVVFIHVPRSGGTSLSKVIYPFWINHFTTIEHLDTFSPWLLRLPRFAVVRNPWERAVSSWSFARAGAGVEGVVVNNVSRYAIPEFERFDTFVTGWLARQRIDRVDPIFRAQSEYVIDRSGKLAVSHLGRLEDLDTTRAWLAETLGREIQVPHLNASRHRYYRDYYTADLRDQIARIYARDVEMFGYEF